MASITWLDFTLPDEQAEPALTEKPAKSSAITALVAGQPGKPRQIVFTKRGASCEKQITEGQADRI